MQQKHKNYAIGVAQSEYHHLMTGPLVIGGSMISDTLSHTNRHTFCTSAHNTVPWQHAPSKQPRQPFLSQSAMRGSHVLACNGVRLTSQLKWRKVGQPARVIPCIDCAMLSQYFAYCTDSTVGSYNITVLNCYNCLFIYLLLTDNGVWLSANSAS